MDFNSDDEIGFNGRISKVCRFVHIQKYVFKIITNPFQIKANAQKVRWNRSYDDKIGENIDGLYDVDQKKSKICVLIKRITEMSPDFFSQSKLMT